MTRILDIKVPDIGDFSDIPVIEVLVKSGDRVSKEQSLVTLESDKATMEVPCPVDGQVVELLVGVGSTVSEGSVIARILEHAMQPGPETGGETTSLAHSETVAPMNPEPVVTANQADDQPGFTSGLLEPAGDLSGPVSSKVSKHDYDLVVLGAGPGGYTAAFRAADLGLKVALVERYPALGGVCLNVGCIPSKTLLHTARIIDEAAGMAEHGIRFGDPRIELEKLRAFKDKVVNTLSTGLAGMAARRSIEVVQGVGMFAAPNVLHVIKDAQLRSLDFAHAIIATGSHSLELPGLPWGDPRLMDSTAALTLEEIPQRLLVISGGIIGLEMACVYAALGSKVTVVELTNQLMPGADPDLVKPLHSRIASRYENIWLETRVRRVDIADDALVARFEGAKAPASDGFDRVLVAVGRVPNGRKIGAEYAGVQVAEKGFIEVDSQMRTNVPHIFAIGDVVGQPMLAHKASHEGKVAAEVCAGEKSYFDARVIPSVAYTDPEVAWVGLTETEARKKGVDYSVSRFPWSASGRAIGIDRTEGFTKLIFDPLSKRIIGAGITGPHAGDLIAECALAIEMGCEAADQPDHPPTAAGRNVAMAAKFQAR
jgi:dihydrolipoamide dehydrogenase